MKPRAQALISQARLWIGTCEEGGDNRGSAVQVFQLEVDTVAAREPWCMAFVQFCLGVTGGSDLFKSEHCLTVWNKSPVALRRATPEPGCVVIWKMRDTSSGHAGIVESVNGGLMKTIEGNTGPATGVIERNGDGVYSKSRSAFQADPNNRMQLLGFLWPWVEG